MAKITKIKRFSARVICCHGTGKCAFLNPAAFLFHKYLPSLRVRHCEIRSNLTYRLEQGIQFMLSENGGMKNLMAALTGLPGGNRNNNGTFNNIGNNGNWWSASESDATNAWKRNLNYNNTNVNRNNNNKAYGFSVRCLRDLNNLFSKDWQLCCQSFFSELSRALARG